MMGKNSQDFIQLTPNKIHQPSNTSKSQGYVLTVPSNNDPTLDPLYTICLLDGETTTAPASAMPTIINKDCSNLKINLLPWIQHDSKVQYTLGRVTHQGRLYLCSNSNWLFIPVNRLGTSIKEISMPDLPFIF